MLHQGHTYHKTMTGYSKQNKKVKMGEGGWEKGGGGEVEMGINEWPWQAIPNKTGKLKWGREGERGGEEVEMGINEWPCWWWNMDHHIYIFSGSQELSKD